MGSDANAYLAYGVCFDQDKHPWKGMDFEVWVEKHHPNKLPERPTTPYGTEEWTQYFKAKRDWVESLGVIYVNYCSGDYPRWALGANGSFIQADWGHPTEINPDKMTEMYEMTEVYDHAVKLFCKQMGIDTTNLTIAWYLMASWY